MADDDYTWQERERRAQYDRIMPVWHRQGWWQNAYHIMQHHYVHVSTTDSKLLAYTQDSDKGRRNIQTPIKPGKYLTKYFSEILTPKQIAFFAAWQTSGSLPNANYADAARFPLMFANTADEIEAVYVAGPDSCMSGAADDYDGPCHPVRVYAAGDLAIAYLHGALASDPTTAKPVARALVWPERKVFNRIYPTDHCWQRDAFMSVEDSRACANELLNRLMAEGYQEGSFNGARLARIECDDDKVVMPYLDRGYRFDDDGEILTMRSGGDHSAEGTDGVARIEPEHTWTCDNCEEGMSDDDEQNTVHLRYSSGRAREARTWCNHCTENDAFYCNGSQDTYSNNVDSTTADGETVCQGWAEYNCVYSDHSEEYHSDATTVEMANGETWTDTEFAEDGFTCAIDGLNYPNNERHAEHRDMHMDASAEDIMSYLNGLAPQGAGIIYDPAQLALEPVT